ncbi:MAG: hypothetical protein IBX39_08275 [Candidatus Methanoperedenaceae archaeon]|nr:hypothetical protein [Candidatus Methanoperedenaceae archaeon]
MKLVIYMLHNPEDKLSGWFAIYDSKNDIFISWDYLHSINAVLPEYMQEHISPDNDYPVIVKQKQDAEKVVSAIIDCSRRANVTDAAQTSFVKTTWTIHTKNQAAQ